jgi:hypothetical protein
MRFGYWGESAVVKFGQKLVMTYVAKCQINSRVCEAGLFGYLMLEVLLRASGHDQEASMMQTLRIDYSPPLALSQNSCSEPRLTEAMTGPISGSLSEWSPTLSFPSRYRLHRAAL